MHDLGIGQAQEHDIGLVGDGADRIGDLGAACAGGVARRCPAGIRSSASFGGPGTTKYGPLSNACTTLATTTTSTTTTLPTTTTRPPFVPEKVLKVGAKGDAVLRMEERLDDLRYDVGKVDGVLGQNTRTAVKAMQIKYGLPADSWPTAELLARMRGGAPTAEATPPSAPVTTAPRAPVRRAAPPRQPQ